MVVAAASAASGSTSSHLSASIGRKPCGRPFFPVSGRPTTTHCASCLSPPFVIFMKRQALLARFRSARIFWFKSRNSNHRNSLDAVGTLLCAAQHMNGLSPTSQFSPSGGVANGPTCGAGMRARPLI